MSPIPRQGMLRASKGCWDNQSHSLHGNLLPSHARDTQTSTPHSSQLLNIMELTRSEVIKHLVDEFVSNMFGDQQEEDYARRGFPDHIGFENMPNERLIDEYNNNITEDEHRLEKISDEFVIEFYIDGTGTGTFYRADDEILTSQISRATTFSSLLSANLETAELLNSWHLRSNETFIATNKTEIS